MLLNAFDHRILSREPSGLLCLQTGLGSTVCVGYDPIASACAQDTVTWNVCRHVSPLSGSTNRGRCPVSCGSPHPSVLPSQVHLVQGLYKPTTHLVLLQCPHQGTSTASVELNPRKVHILNELCNNTLFVCPVIGEKYTPILSYTIN